MWIAFASRSQAGRPSMAMRFMIDFARPPAVVENLRGRNIFGSLFRRINRLAHPGYLRMSGTPNWRRNMEAGPYPPRSGERH
jgi:hypothetical protein